jgi:hypothetical protein
MRGSRHQFYFSRIQIEAQVPWSPWGRSKAPAQWLSPSHNQQVTQFISFLCPGYRGHGAELLSITHNVLGETEALRSSPGVLKQGSLFQCPFKRDKAASAFSSG